MDNQVNETSKARLRYMVSYIHTPPRIVACKGDRIVKIYIARGFTEVDAKEFDRLVKIRRGE